MRRATLDAPMVPACIKGPGKPCRLPRWHEGGCERGPTDAEKLAALRREVRRLRNFIDGMLHGFGPCSAVCRAQDPKAHELIGMKR